MHVLFQIDGIDETQNPEEFIIHVSLDGKELPETFHPTKKVNEFSYWAMGILNLPFDANDREEIKLDAWVELPENGLSRHVLEKIKPAGCGWTGTMNGTRSGDLKGNLVLNLLDFTDVDPSVWEGLGFTDGIPLAPDPDSGEELSDTLFLTGHPPFPALMVNELGFAIAIFDSNGDAAFGTLNPETLKYSEQSDEHLEGFVNTTMLDARNQGEITLNAEFVWNAGSLCDIELMLASVNNNLEEIESPQ